MRLRMLGSIMLMLAPATAFAAPLPDLPDGWSEHYAYANGIRIHYYHAVPAPGKPTIIAVHGAMDTGLAWASVAMKLQSDYDVYMLDTRGHGLSDPYNGTEDRTTLLKDVMEMAKVLGVEKPIVMGHSMGAGTSMRIGADYPDFARAIILLDPGLGPRAPRPARPAAPAAREAPADQISISMGGSPENLVAQNNHSVEELMAKAHSDNPKWSPMDCRYWAHAIAFFHGRYSEEARPGGPGGMRSEDSLAKIQVPVLILKADAPPEMRKVHQEAAKVIPHGKLVHIDDAAHNLQRDQPQRAYEVIKSFLTTL